MINLISKKFIPTTKNVLFVISRNNSTSNIEWVDGGVPKIIINKPKALNSLSLQMVKDFNKLMPKIQKYPAFWVEGAGGKAFCAGGDVKCFFQSSGTVELRQQFFKHQFTLDYQLAVCKSLEIVNWDGIVMGGGFGISNFAPFRIATQSTMLAMPQAKIGFFTDVGAGYALAHMRNNIGMYIALTSGRLKGQDVFNSGFANYFVTKENIPKIYSEINTLVKDHHNAQKIIQDVLKKYHKGNPNKKIQHQEEISQIFGGATVKEIYQRAKASKTAFGQSALKALESVCPLSVHVIQRLVRQSKHLDKKQVFLRDFILAQNFSINKNFESGVKSLLILKDNNPKWSHQKLLDVTQEQVNEMFKQRADKKRLQL